MSFPAPTLQTTRLLLRPFADSDADAIYALQSNARVLRYWDSPPWKDPSRAVAFIAACRQIEQDRSGARFAIESRGSNRFLGWCSMFRWNPVYRSLGIGYCLEEAAWGQGFATEAVRAMLTWAYESLDLNRVEAELDTRNAASARVLEKLGFEREGLRREDCVVDGEVSDSWIYGLLKRDWGPRVGAAQSGWCQLDQPYGTGTEASRQDPVRRALIGDQGTAYEPRRCLRPLQSLRAWSHDDDKQGLTGVGLGGGADSPSAR